MKKSRLKQHKVMIHIFTCLIMLVGVLNTHGAWAFNDTYRIGVLAHRGKIQAVSRWKSTADYLTEEIGQKFEIVPLNLDEIANEIQSGRIHFTLTNPGNYVFLETTYGASRIATLQTREQGKTHVRYGAVIISRADNSGIQSLRDLKGKRFMAVSRQAFGGFQMAWRELVEHNINPFKDFKKIEFAGFPQDKLIYAVQKGKTDAATVRAETFVRMIESGQIDIGEFNILNRQYVKDYPFPLSTRLYPEWPFATLKNTSRRLATKVAQALLSMPASHPAAMHSRITGWTVPLDYSPVHQLMKVLQIGPYKVSSLWVIIKRYAGWFEAAGAGLIILILFSGYVSRTNRRLKETELNLLDEIHERKKTQEELVRYQDKLEELVAVRTNNLKTMNTALEKSKLALRELVRITSAPDLSHDEKLSRLLYTGREYYGTPVAILARVGSDDKSACKVSGNMSMVADLQMPLNEKCASQLTERNGEPLDIPNLEKYGGPDCSCIQKGWKSYLGTAVYVEGKIHCTLEFADVWPRGKVLSQWDYELLKVMAQWIGDEIERQKLFELEQSHRAEIAHVSRMSTIGEMAASLAHELNQPLTGAINYSNGCLRLMREDHIDKNKLIQGVDRAVECATLAADIIRNIREFVQKDEAEHALINLNSAVKNVIKLVLLDAQQHEVDLELRLARTPPLVHGNMIQLEQVILNFIRNAIDAMKKIQPSKRQLIITTTQESNKVILSAKDNGKGIPETSMKKIFDAFYTTKSDGMGMGLSISRSIVESHQGKIMAKSLTQGGAEVSFELPAAHHA